MKRFQISIDPELHRQLEAYARREGVSKAEAVRRSLRATLPPAPSLADDPLWSLVATGTGGGRKPGETTDDLIYGPKRDR